MKRMSRSLAAILIVSFVSSAYGLQCYDCYGTGPDHKECTEQRTCNGVACMIFDAGDNRTASAFCLLAMKGQKMEEAKDGCWLEPDGKGKHCMCFTDFCNKLIDRRNTDEADPMAPLLPTADFLKQNPLVDYDAPNLGDYVDNGAHPPPKHVLFPSADKQDPRIAGASDDDEDLVPVEFEDYKNIEEISEPKPVSSTAVPTTTLEGVPLPEDTPEDTPDVDDESEQMNIESDDEERSRNRPNARVPEDRSQNEISATYKPSSWVLFAFPLAASWARFMADF